MCRAARPAEKPRRPTHPGPAGIFVRARLHECDGEHVLWRTPRGGARTLFGDAERNRVWVLDVDGERLVVNTVHYEETPAEDLGELDAMVESIRIGP